MRRQFTLSTKIPAVALSVCLVFGFISWLLLSTQINHLAKQAVFSKGTSTLERLTELIITPLFNSDTISVQVALKKATQDPSIISASLFGVDQELITQSIKPKPAQLEAQIFTRNLELQNTQIGIITVVVDRQPIYQKYQQSYINWLILWACFTLLTTYLSHRFADQISLRIRRLNERLPGSSEPMADELANLETKVQPLLSKVGESTENSSNTYYYSLITAQIKNRQRLGNQLNQESLDRLFEKLDYCFLRTLQLYGGTRVDGDAESICFTIRSTQCTKQHLLVCLMAVYSLRQLIENLSVQQGVDLEINWTVSSQEIETSPQFYFEQGLARIRQKNAQLGGELQAGLIALNCENYTVDELSSIAHFATYKEQCFVLEGFSENRQQLLEKQLQHLINLCLS